MKVFFFFQKKKKSYSCLFTVFHLIIAISGIASILCKFLMFFFSSPYWSLNQSIRFCCKKMKKIQHAKHTHTGETWSLTDWPLYNHGGGYLIERKINFIQNPSLSIYFLLHTIYTQYTHYTRQVKGIIEIEIFLFSKSKSKQNECPAKTSIMICCLLMLMFDRFSLSFFFPKTKERERGGMISKSFFLSHPPSTFFLVSFFS